MALQLESINVHLSAATDTAPTSVQISYNVVESTNTKLRYSGVWASPRDKLDGAVADLATQITVKAGSQYSQGMRIKVGTSTGHTISAPPSGNDLTVSPAISGAQADGVDVLMEYDGTLSGDTGAHWDVWMAKIKADESVP